MRVTARYKNGYQRRFDWTDPRNVELLTEAWNACQGKTILVAKKLRMTRGTVIGASRRLGLHRGSKPKPIRLRLGSPAVEEARTIFPATRTDPEPGLLRPGAHSFKLGSHVTKGRWRGMPIYSLTLEERATCPSACPQWRSCYGNHMHMATRFGHGHDLVMELAGELGRLQERHPGGFVVRLHVLGDFYSVEYVEQWAYWLTCYPALRIFGYTHWQEDHPIGQAVALYRDHWWDRFAIRTSDAPGGPRTTIYPDGLLLRTKKDDEIVCPVQTNKTKTCGTCGLCWNSQRPIAFIEH